MEDLFTYILDFRGGTYVSQVKSKDLESSIEKWVQKLEIGIHEIEHLGPKTIEEIKSQLLEEDSDERPVLLRGLKNIWCMTINTRKGFGIIHVIKTNQKVTRASKN